MMAMLWAVAGYDQASDWICFRKSRRDKAKISVKLLK